MYTEEEDREGEVSKIESHFKDFDNLGIDVRIEWANQSLPILVKLCQIRPLVQIAQHRLDVINDLNQVICLLRVVYRCRLVDYELRYDSTDLQEKIIGQVDFNNLFKPRFNFCDWCAPHALCLFVKHKHGQKLWKNLFKAFLLTFGEIHRIFCFS